IENALYDFDERADVLRERVLGLHINLSPPMPEPGSLPAADRPGGDRSRDDRPAAEREAAARTLPPSRHADERAEGAALPPTAEESPAASEPPAPVEAQEAADEPAPLPEGRRERIREATAHGGLDALPPSFA